MQTSLDFLGPGKQWPPPDEEVRLNQYESNKLLFEGKHDQVFTDWPRLLREDQQATMELILNWHKRLSLLWSDLLLGEPPEFSAGDPETPEQDALERLLIENSIDNTAYEVVIDISRFGDGLFKVRYDKRGIIEGQPPTVWFPVVKPDNIRDVTAHVLAWKYTEENDGRKNDYLQCEIHEKGLITSRLYSLKEDRIDKLLQETKQETGVDEFLIIPVANILTTDRIHGLDDYSDLDSIIQEIEIRISQISRILDKHADPNMYGPDSALSIDPETGETYFRAGGKFFPVGPDEQPPGYATYDGKLDAAFKQIDYLIEQLYFLSETSPAAFGQLKSGLAESGSALRRLMMAPLAKVNRVRMRFDPALKMALRIASELEAAQGMVGAVRIEDIHITWKDGLPEDITEAVQNETTRFGAGLSSLESSLNRLDGLEGDALKEEIARIKADKAAAQGAMQPPRVTLPPGPGQQQAGAGE